MDKQHTTARCASALAVFVATTALAAPAGARMELGIQDDHAAKYAPAAFTERAGQVGAEWVRLTIPSGRWRLERDAYRAAAQHARDSGHRVLVTLMGWDARPTPTSWAPHVADVVRDLAPDVDAWSPLNEPNQHNMRPACPHPCGWRALGRAYRRIWDRAARIIRRLDPTAKRVVGDLMPLYSRRFMRGYYAPGRPAVRPHVLAIHPYPNAESRPGHWGAQTVRGAARFARRHRLALWGSEFALLPTEPARHYTRWLRQFRKAGLAVVILYDVDSRKTDPDGWWNTRLTGAALRLLADVAQRRRVADPKMRRGLA